MTHTLVTFLGRGRGDPNTGYSKARYRFPDATESTTAFFGLALAKHLAPDRIVILGTRASQWGVLAVENADVESEDENTLLESLMDSADGENVDQALLDKVEEIMSRMVGIAVTPRLIPFGKDESEQYEILSTVADAVPNGEVSFDLTHGFRHLGMVGFLSAFMLERVRNLKVQGLWYGALDMATSNGGVAPVVRLDGLTRVRRWINALDRFDATGDYGVFAPLLIEDGVEEEQAKHLERAAYFERTMNLSDAWRELEVFRPTLYQEIEGASGMFRQTLLDRLDWTSNASLENRQRKLAYKHLARGDYLRAAIHGFESVITTQCEQRGLTAGDYGAGRKPARDAFEDELKRHDRGTDRAEAYWRLKAIRDTMAHGSPPTDKRDRKVLKDEDRLSRALAWYFKVLLGPDK